MRPSDNGRFRLFWPSQQLETFNIMIPSSLKLNSDEFTRPLASDGVLGRKNS